MTEQGGGITKENGGLEQADRDNQEQSKEKYSSNG
jgi:hypothetical protein